MSTNRPGLPLIRASLATKASLERDRHAIALASSQRTKGVKQVHRAVDGRGVARRREPCSTFVSRCHS